ncbi:hypothetical protein CL620_04990 [archaeon]|jgi:hypothetical protein|nr:hypothetical protein [archaeon]|tara:strand:+ start:3424 stop:3645 length:222 start_codon:yes stop_codon:yes gene_type:complete
MFYNISEYLEFNHGEPVVSGIVENIGTLNRIRPWISELVKEEVYNGSDVKSTLVTEYISGEDIYQFKLVYTKC